MTNALRTKNDLRAGGLRLIQWLVLAGMILSLGGVETLHRAAAAPSAPTADGALHNGSFDNHRWYEFNDRYKTWLAGSYMPDDDAPGGVQDWRLWYMRGTPIIKSFSEQDIVQAVESLGIRSYSGSFIEGGFYQEVSGVTPCLSYQFQIYALTRPYDSLPDKRATLKVGIDQIGWHPDAATDPAFPGYYPTSIVWGEAQDYKYPNFGLLTATAEARADKITVFTYAYALGGFSHPIVWDTASLAEVTPAMIHDPAALPAPGGVTDLAHIAGQYWALITWNTAQPAVGQVYYRLLPQSQPPANAPYKIYLPMVISGPRVQTWVASTLNKTPTTSHSGYFENLLAGRTYEYIAVARGVSGGQCVTWVSSPQQFTTAP